MLGVSVENFTWLGERPDFFVFLFGVSGLIVRLPGYRSRGPGFDSLPDFLENSGSGMGSTQPHENS
jgi:hypothetical protein